MNKLIKEKKNQVWTKPVLTMIMVREHWRNIFPSAPLSSDCREPSYTTFQKKEGKKKKEEVRKSNHFNVNKGRSPSLEAWDASGACWLPLC